MERRRRTRVKPKPIRSKNLSAPTEQEPEAPKVLSTAIREVEKDVKTFKPDAGKPDSFADLQSKVYTCFIELDTMGRMSSLETIKIYLDENLDEYREIIITQLDTL